MVSDLVEWKVRGLQAKCLELYVWYTKSIMHLIHVGTILVYN